MYRSIRLMITVAAVLVICRAATDRGEATVVRDSKKGPVNPAVEVGGHRLHPNRPLPVVPASLIGVWRPEYPWLPSCIAWPLAGFRPFYWDHRAEGWGGPAPGAGSLLRLRRSGE